MTEKEKLKEIKKLADAMYYAAFNLTTDASLLRNAMKEYHQFIIHEYCKEEPIAPKVLEDMLNAKTAAESLGVSQEEHDRIVDELIYGKEPELVDVDDLPNKEEEPVSDECIYNRTLKERQKSCKFCSAACQVRIKEEPVSEDFEEALAREWKGYNDRGAATVDALEDNTQELAFAKGFYLGANWQKQQDQETIKLAEDHAMLAGMEKMKEQMMAKAVDGDITFDYYGDGDKTYGCIAHNSFCLEDFGLKDRDKVKVIVIKVY